MSIKKANSLLLPRDNKEHNFNQPTLILLRINNNIHSVNLKFLLIISGGKTSYSKKFDSNNYYNNPVLA